MDIIYHNLLWVSISYSSTINCIDKELIAWGHFPSVNLYCVSFLSLSTASMMGGLLSSIRLSELLVGSTRTAALCMPVTFFRTALADGILCREVVMARGCEGVQLGYCEADFLWLVFLGLMALAEGVYGFTSTQHNCSRLNGITHMTNLSRCDTFFS